MCHVLILDDDDLFGRALADSLHRSTEPRFKAVAVTTADEARRAVLEATEPFDALLADQRLSGGVDGIEVAQELMQLQPGAGLIVFTGYDDPEVGLRAYQAGAYRYLPKPFQARELIWILRAMQDWRAILNEYNWLHVVNVVAEQAQRALSTGEVGEVFVQGGLKLGFERARLWLALETAQNLRCANQAERETAVKLTGLVMLAAESPYNSQAMQKHEPVFYRGREHGTGYLEKVAGEAGFQPPIGEWTAIPLWAGDHCLGILVLDNATRPVQLSSGQRNFLQLYGSQAAAALERVRLFDLEKRRVEELAVLNQIGRDVTAIDDLDELLNQVYVSVGRLMNVDNFRIALVDDETDQLHFRLCVDGGKVKLPYFRPRHDGLIGHLIDHNRPLRLNNGTHDYRVEHGIRRVGRAAQSWLGAPLRVGPHAVGAITIQDYRRRQVYSNKDEDLLIAVADQIAGVIKTARLKEHEKRNAEQLEALHSASKIIMRLAEEKEDWLWHATLTIATAHYALSFNRAMLLWLDADGRRLRGRAGIGHFDTRLARLDWKRDERKDMTFDEYLGQLMADQLARTPIEQTVSDLSFAVAAGTDALSDVVNDSHRLVIPALEAAQRLPEEFVRRFGVTDYALVPLRAGDRLLGLVVVDNFIDREPLSRPDLNRLESFLAEAALVYENVRQRRALDQLLDLNYAVLAKSSTRPLKEVLTQVAERAQALTAADVVAIYPLKPAQLPYEYDEANVAIIGRRTPRQLSEQPRPRGITGHIVRAGTLVIRDVLTDNAHYDGALLCDSNFVQREDVRAFIGTPARDVVTSELLGVVYLNYRSPRQFNERDLRLAELFANLAAAAMRSSHTTQQMKDGLQAAESRGQSNEHELRRLSAMLEESLTTTEEGNLIRTVLTAVRDLLNQPDLRIGVMLRDWKPSQPELEPSEIRQQYYLNRDNTVSCTEEQNIYRGIIGVAIGGGESQLVPDVSQPEWQHFYHKAWPETRSELVVPIKFGSQIIGAINIESPRAGVLTVAHQVTLERLANATALALDNVRRQAHLHSILSAATAITLPVDLKATLQVVVHEIQQTVPALSCLTIWYREPNGERILPGRSFGVHDTPSMQLPLAKDSVVYHVMQLAEPIWALVADEEPNLSGRFVKAEQIISTAAFPLRADNDTVGAMFFNYRQPHDFTAEEAALFPILAAIVASSVRDAAHLEGIRSAYRSLDAAFAITQAVNTSLDLNEVLGSIMATLCSRFKGATACVMTYDETEQMLTFQPASRTFYPIDESAYVGLPGVYLDQLSIASDVARQSLMSGRTAKANVGDVDVDSRYFRLVHAAKSELCISLMSSTAELLGVVVLERPEREAFDEEEVLLITSAAQQISMALERVYQGKQLRFKSTVATATAWASDIAHEINREVSNIRNKAARIGGLVPLAEDALLLLAAIDASADRLAMAQSSSLLTMNAELKEFELDVELEARVREIVALAFRPTDLDFDLGCACHKVNVRQAVFGRVLRHLVRNAIQAMRDLDDSRLFVRTRLWRDRFIQVFIEDIGPGVPDDVLPTLFEVPATEGRGYGLLFVRAAVEDILGGRVWYLPRTTEHGPTFTFTIPTTNHLNEG